MGYQSSGGCGCSAARSAPQSACNPKGGAAAVQPCLTPVPAGCNTDLNIVQGEDLRVPMCFSGAMSQVRCLNVDGSITTTEALSTAQKVRLACTGTEWASIAGVYDVTANDIAAKKLSLNGFVIAEQKCFESQIRNIPGCKSNLAVQTPPTVIEHIDSSDWILEGSIYTKRGTTGSKRTFGATITSGSDTIYYTIDRKVSVGESVCVYLPNGTVKAKVLRVLCDEIINECGDIEKATFLELDTIMPSVPDGTCAAITVDAGPLLDLQFETTASGCTQIVLPWTETRELPFITGCEADTRVPACDDESRHFLGWWDVFATIPYLNTNGQLRTERKRVACGCAYVLASSAGFYSNC